MLHPEFISAYRPFIKWSITWRQWLRGETARGIVGDGEREVMEAGEEEAEAEAGAEAGKENG